MRLRRELHRLIGRLAPLLLLALGGCVSTVVGAAVDVATAPVRIVAAGIDAVTPSRREADRRRGRRERKAEEQARREARHTRRDPVDGGS